MLRRTRQGWAPAGVGTCRGGHLRQHRLNVGYLAVTLYWCSGQQEGVGGRACVPHLPRSCPWQGWLGLCSSCPHGARLLYPPLTPLTSPPVHV